jgi:uridine kinase
VDSPTQQADTDAILLMDGVFLLRPELAGYWDLKIFLDVDFLVSLGRAKMRDRYYLGSPDEVMAKYNERYWPGQNLYFQKALPKEGADFVVDNNDFRRPVLICPWRAHRKDCSKRDFQGNLERD